MSHITARAAHILQDESNRDTALEKTTLTFLTCLFSEEAKLLCRAEREEMDIDYSIRDRLDWPPSDGMFSLELFCLLGDRTRAGTTCVSPLVR